MSSTYRQISILGALALSGSLLEPAFSFEPEVHEEAYDGHDSEGEEVSVFPG